MDDQFDLLAALEARDNAMALVEKNGGTWHQRAAVLAKHMLPKGWSGIGEDIRRMLIESDCLEPPHCPQSWGVLSRRLIEDGFLQATGEWRRPTAKKSKGRPCQVYRRAA
jgi:hypothetical protein